MIKKTINAVGSVVCVLAILFTVRIAYDNNFLEEVLPEKSVATPVAIRLFGPHEVINGTEHYFHVEVSGKSGTPEWKLVPPVPGALTVFPDGLKARFLTTQPGPFVLCVAVAGEGLDVASDAVELDTLQIKPEEEHDDHNDAPPMPVPTGPPPATLSGEVLRALSEVPSENRVEEAHNLAGTIVMLIKRIETENLAPGVDVVEELEVHAEAVLGDNAKHWGLFFAELRAIFQTLQEQGTVTTAPTAVRPLAEIAAVLKNAK